MSQTVHVARYGALYRVALGRSSADATDATKRHSPFLAFRPVAENRPPVWTGR